MNDFTRPINERGWKIEARVRAIAGGLILASALLTWLYGPWWLLLTAFVGVNLMQSAFTNWCLMTNLLAVAFPAIAQEQ